MSKEQAIIDLIAHQTGQKAVLADDAFFDPASRLIYTTDMLVEEQHFSMRYFSPQDLGWKAAAVNISDIAAMGGRLKYLLVSLGLPENTSLDWVHSFYQGLTDACQQFGGHIIGGDTVGSPQITLNVTAIGECPAGHNAGHRYNAQAGDIIIATGFHGLSNVGLSTLQQQMPGYDACKQAHLRPMPRIEAGLLLSRKFEHYALMDSSDGLADALIKIARASKKVLIADISHLPVHPEVTAYHQMSPTLPATSEEIKLWDTILYGGEDFELIATVPAVDDDILHYFHVIGRVEDAVDNEFGAWLSQDTKGQRIPLSQERTYQHFGSTHA